MYVHQLYLSVQINYAHKLGKSCCQLQFHIHHYLGSICKFVSYLPDWYMDTVQICYAHKVTQTEIVDSSPIPCQLQFQLPLPIYQLQSTPSF